jgi:hypothetical protein
MYVQSGSSPPVFWRNTYHHLQGQTVSQAKKITQDRWQAEVESSLCLLSCSFWFLARLTLEPSWDRKKSSSYEFGTDKMIPRYAYEKSFTIRFPNRSESKMGFGPIEMED